MTNVVINGHLRMPEYMQMCRRWYPSITLDRKRADITGSGTLLVPTVFPTYLPIWRSWYDKLCKEVNPTELSNLVWYHMYYVAQPCWGWSDLEYAVGVPEVRC